jgi:3,4-dihydroxy-2-butanone 4-phosphate synthase
MPGDRLDELQLPLMVPNNEEKHKTAYTVTVDYKHGMFIMCPRWWADL